MASIINYSVFQNLKTCDEIKDKEKKSWKVVVPNCGGPGKYCTHLLEDYLQHQHYVFHDGVNMRYLDEKNKQRDGAICGAFDYMPDPTAEELIKGKKFISSAPDYPAK